MRFTSRLLKRLVVLSFRVDIWEDAQVVMSPRDRFRSFRFFSMFSPRILKADFQDSSMNSTNYRLEILLSSSASMALKEYIMALFLSERISLMPWLKLVSLTSPSLF